MKDDNAEIILDELENGFSYIASPFDGCIIDGNKITEITKDIVISLAAHEMQYRLEGDEVFVSARNKKIWGGISIPSEVSIGNEIYKVTGIQHCR